MANEGQWRPDLLKGCLYGAPLWESLWTFEGYIEPRSPALQLDSLPSEPPGKPLIPYSSVQFSHSVMSNSLRPHESQHARPPCSSPTPGVYSNSCPSSQWCHPAISSSVVPFSSCLQSFPAWESFPVSQFFTSGGQNIGVSASASVLPMSTQDWFPLGWPGLISLQSKGPPCRWVGLNNFIHLTRMPN